MAAGVVGPAKARPAAASMGRGWGRDTRGTFASLRLRPADGARLRVGGFAPSACKCRCSTAAVALPLRMPPGASAIAACTAICSSCTRQGSNVMLQNRICRHGGKAAQQLQLLPSCHLFCAARRQSASCRQTSSTLQWQGRWHSRSLGS
eukprot:354411-Chlamydomonas_euryale.AAC.22